MPPMAEWLQIFIKFVSRYTGSPYTGDVQRVVVVVVVIERTD